VPLGGVNDAPFPISPLAPCAAYDRFQGG
jgi:hypothetical protein